MTREVCEEYRSGIQARLISTTYSHSTAFNTLLVLKDALLGRGRETLLTRRGAYSAGWRPC
jgi:hypothetical protein